MTFPIDRFFRALVLALVWALIPLLHAGVRAGSPRVWVWAWDRPEDLRFLKPEDAGVAFFVLGISMNEKGVTLRPRTAPLRLSRGMHRIAVVRLEMSSMDAPERQMKDVLRAIHSYALVPGIEGLQLDFDASRSQRPFYRKLVERLRKDPEVRIPISITALASWCMGDRWIQDLPVSEAVAMLFQMGPDGSDAMAWLRKGRPLAGANLGTLAWGLSTDQPLSVSPPAQARVYLFHPRSWTPTAFQKVLPWVQP